MGGDLPAGSEGAARLFYDQPSRAHHPAARAGQPVGGGGGDLPHGQPRDFQGVAVHGRGYHRPRNRHARFAQAERSCRSEEHTSELQSLMRISYAVFCLKKKKQITTTEFVNYSYKTITSARIN